MSKISILASWCGLLPYQAAGALDNLPQDIFNHPSPDYIQRQLRVHTQGNSHQLLSLFKEAEERDLSLAQIHLASAYSLQQRKGAEKDFTNITSPQQLETSPYIAEWQQNFLEWTFKAIHPEWDYSSTDKAATSNILKAAKQGSAYAQLVRSIKYKLERKQFYDCGPIETFT